MLGDLIVYLAYLSCVLFLIPSFGLLEPHADYYFMIDGKTGCK